MAGDLKSLEDISQKDGRSGLASHLQSCGQKALRALFKAADLPQRVSGRYLSVEELRHNLLEHVVTSMQAGLEPSIDILSFFNCKKAVQWQEAKSETSSNSSRPFSFTI